MENNQAICGADVCTPHLSDGTLCLGCPIAEEYWSKEARAVHDEKPPVPEAKKPVKKEDSPPLKKAEELTEEKIRECVSTNQRWCERAILAIYRRQTREEKIAQETKENNGVGFSGPDGHKMSYYAQWILSGKHLTGRFLEDAFKRIPKYARQLLKIAQELKLGKK